MAGHKDHGYLCPLAGTVRVDSWDFGGELMSDPTRDDRFKAAVEVALAALNELMKVQGEYEQWHPVYELDIQSMVDQIRGAKHG